jgi:AraC family transcriptional regulator
MYSSANCMPAIQFADSEPAARNSSGSLPQLTVSGGHKDAGKSTRAVGPPSSIREVIPHPTVEVSPSNVTRRSLTGHGVTAESIDYIGPDTVLYRFRGSQHLLVAYEQDERESRETFVEGVPSSSLRKLARRLTFVPAGHEYREQYRSRANTRLTFLLF